MKIITIHSKEEHQGKYKIATEDYLNNIFGSFLVVLFAGYQVYGKVKNRIFNCVCTICKHKKLISGRTLSYSTSICKGCKRKKADENTVTVALKERYKVYQNGAIARNYDFNLSLVDFSNLVLNNCHYCGIEPSNIYINRLSKIPTKLNGVDRKDNSLGYSNENCVTCCKDCNRAKSSLAYDLFLEWMNRISKNIVNLKNEESNISL